MPAADARYRTLRDWLADNHVDTTGLPASYTELRVLSAKRVIVVRRLLFVFAGRFDPEEELVPFVMFAIRGAGSPVPRSGESHIGPVALGPAQTQVTINFIGVDNRLRGDLRLKLQCGYRENV